MPLILGGVDCYSRGDGSAPPRDVFYYPVGLRVSANGSVLYVVNSDFDLQYNGGTIQSYDLQKVREDAAKMLAHPPPGCPSVAPGFRDDGSGTRQPLGEQCAPPRDSRPFYRRSVVIGAFATDLQISAPPDRLTPSGPPSGMPCAPDGTCQGGLVCSGGIGAHVGTCEPVSNRALDRLFVPVRGNASVTWVDTTRDVEGQQTPPDAAGGYAPFELDCAQDSEGRCSGSHAAGTDATDNSRGFTMPGEPFGMTISPDGESLLVTHQTDTKVSLFSTGLSRDPAAPIGRPTIDFVLDGLPTGGVGLASVPHDRESGVAPPPFDAFLWTTRASAEVDLVRRYPDQASDTTNDAGFQGAAASSLHRPFIDREQVFPILPTAGGSDSRGIAIDSTPRLACKARVAAADPASGRTQSMVDAETLACARKPARVYIANRSPASLIIGEIGADAPNGGAYDPDRLTLETSIPMRAGPSNVYLAPVVDPDGSYALRVFVTCFDSAEVFIFNPDTQLIENEIRVGPGPFALAFDPFRIEDVATNAKVPADPVYSASTDADLKTLRKYRFAYVASFTQSFVQLIDLDNGEADRTTYERVVYTLGNPTNPLESQ
ncbi:MAG TPA: hypothetical protein VIF62_33775 [Labilithrix sp.]